MGEDWASSGDDPGPRESDNGMEESPRDPAGTRFAAAVAPHSRCRQDRARTTEPMIRAHVFPCTAPTDRWFRWRGASVSRAEALADGVFALALAFLITSIPVPNTYTELVQGLRHLPALAVCFAMLMFLWYSHHIFFRRFGLEDRTTLVFNAGFLFLVLAYVHPLRFLASFLFCAFSGGALSPPAKGEYLADGDGRWLMPFYSSGVVAVFAMLLLMHCHAWRRRKELQLDEIEEHLLRDAIGSHAISTGIGLLSLVMALATPSLTSVSGWIYCAMGPLHGWHGSRTAKRLARLTATPPAAT